MWNTCIFMEKEFPFVTRNSELSERTEFTEASWIHSSWPIKQNCIATWFLVNQINQKPLHSSIEIEREGERERE